MIILVKSKQKNRLISIQKKKENLKTNNFYLLELLIKKIPHQKTPKDLKYKMIRSKKLSNLKLHNHNQKRVHTLNQLIPK